MDWSGLLRLGLERLRLAPEAFWALTPLELLVMLGRAGRGDAAMGRRRLEELLGEFPDGEDE